MPSPILPAPPQSQAHRSDRCHLFGVVGTMADAVTRMEREQRRRVCAEAERVSGNFYIDRLVGAVRTR